MFHVKHWRRTEAANLGASKSPIFACASEIVSCETFPHLLFRSLLPFNQSPVANRRSLSFSDLPICRPHDLPISFGSAGASPSHFCFAPRPASHAPFFSRWLRKRSLL